MKRWIRCLALAVAICVLGSVDSALGCTTFALKTPQGTFFGRNYDFPIGYGMLVTNKRGIGKEAALDSDSDKPARWLSRYGSLTFNQFGREFPQGGMNEAGLVVELMWLDATTYPAADERPAVSELGWIQYMLDTCATVHEVTERATRIRIAGSVPIHFLVADKTGATATVEFIAGKLVTHSDDALPVPVLTNDTYDASTEYLRKHQGFGGNAPLGGSTSSLDRFCRAASRVKVYSAATSGSPVEYAFGILADVAQPRATQWSIVYDTAKLTVYFKTMDHPDTRSVALGAFELSCVTPVHVYDLASTGKGDVSAQFVDYTRAANLNLVTKSFSSVEFLKNTPAQVLEEIASYPEELPCTK